MIPTEPTGAGAAEETLKATPVETGDAATPPETATELAQLRAEAAKAQERYLRTAADFDNFKKRAARERQEAGRNAQEALLSKVIPVLDNFEMALAAVDGAPGATVESLRTGVAMIHSQLKTVLGEVGLEAIDAVGQTFDPNWHEAVAQAESSEVSDGQVLQQVMRGYKFRDRLVRPARVVVARSPSATAASPMPPQPE